MKRRLFPNAFIYEKEYLYWPWGRVLQMASKWILANARQGDCIIDYMCGTGFLLNAIIESRKDLHLYGCSLTRNFIKFGLKNYKNIDLQLCNALEYKPPRKPDIIICTAGIHHLTYANQKLFVEKVASELGSNGWFLVGEEILRDFTGEKDRKIAVHELWSSLIAQLIENNSPVEIVKAAINVELNDLFELEEYKLSRSQLIDLLSSYFKIESEFHIWPENDSSFGDVLIICKTQ